jgi:wobble nucleotide-excising tRNase
VITGIRLIRSVGKFDYAPAGAVRLDRYVFVYAENGRGKTTLTAVLRSLATGDPIPIRERRRLAAVHPPQIVLECSAGPNPAVFENGAWNRTMPEISVFDDQFVHDNIYSGLSVQPAQRQALHELVIGSRGVELNRELQALVQRIEEHNAELRIKAAALPQALREGLTVDDFCGLAAVPDVDARTQGAERELAAARQQDAIRDTPEFEPIELPVFELDPLAETLAINLPDLDAAAVGRVQSHFHDIGRNGELWVADGMGRILHLPNGSDLCPFCAQDLAQSEVIDHYRHYFSNEYAALKRRVSELLADVRHLHDPDTPARLERILRVASERRRFWSDFCDVPEIRIDTREVIDRWRTSHNGIVALLEEKQASPLERMEVPEALRMTVAAFARSRETVVTLSEQLQRANAAIRQIKERVVAADSLTIAARLARLRATRTRHSPDVAPLCEEYIAARTAKTATEQARDRIRERLERYRAQEFPGYQLSINAYLGRFGAGYQLDRVVPADTRGGPTCNYDVLINRVRVPVDGTAAGQGEPSFRTVLSSGDRNALALAFFFSSVERDPDLENKILVIDDPISSLDEHRALTTVQEARRLGDRASQMILLSHDKRFLCRVWEGLDPARCSGIKLDRDGEGSTVAAWDIANEDLTEHDRNHSLLRSYLQNGPRGDSRPVATALRPVIEAFLRVSFPEHFLPGPGAMARFRDRCVRDVGTREEILDGQDTRELADILEYANLFHHNTNPAWHDVLINDGELRGFVQRTLRFATRRP